MNVQGFETLTSALLCSSEPPPAAARPGEALPRPAVPGLATHFSSLLLFKPQFFPLRSGQNQPRAGSGWLEAQGSEE